MIDASEVVIWSADVDKYALDRVLSNPAQPIRLIKLDRVRLTQWGLRIISRLQERGYRVFADAKISEIADKVLEITELHLVHRPWMLNVMTEIWSTGFMTHEDPKKVDALKRFADACHAAETKPCAVTVLTNTTEEVARAKYNGRSAVEQVLVFVEVLLEAGFTDVVCSPLEVAAIRAEPRFDSLMLNTPGIRLAGDSSDDQARVSTPAGAIANGSDRLVIGRSLTDSPIENFARIAADLATLEESHA